MLEVVLLVEKWDKFEAAEMPVPKMGRILKNTLNGLTVHQCINALMHQCINAASVHQYINASVH